MTIRALQNEKMRGHKLWTAALRQQIPAFGVTDNDPDPIAYVKFFTPDSGWYWYATEFDGQDTLFGLVFGHYVELGSFSLSELEELRGPLGLPVERELHFKPQRLSEIKLEHQKREGNYRIY